MSTPALHAIQESMNKIQRELAEIKRRQKSLFLLVILIAFVIIDPSLFPFALAAFIIWQVFDAVHRRSLRKRREQQVFRQLSGRM